MTVSGLFAYGSTSENGLKAEGGDRTIHSRGFDRLLTGHGVEATTAQKVKPEGMCSLPIPSAPLHPGRYRIRLASGGSLLVMISFPSPFSLGVVARDGGRRTAGRRRV